MMEYERTYERKYETAEDITESFIRELVFKGRSDRLWDYYGRRNQGVNRHGYRRKGEV